MSGPLVSVIIPVYNGRDLVGEAIRSVLDQTYRDFELLVVDDGSPEGCRDIVDGFADRRIRFIRHSQNNGAQAARRTGVEASSGEVVFFLDQDDCYHPLKLERHVAFMQAHPDVGLSYNPHFTVLHPMGWIVGIWRPPTRMTLADLVLGFPIAPSVWVMRRSWAFRDELYDESARLRGAEAVICGRLLVAGCRFGIVEQALNYRRTHVGRRFSDPVSKCREERRCQDRMIDDPRSPDGTAALRGRAHVGNYLVWANVAFAQGDGETGRDLLKAALEIDPGIAKGAPSPLADFVLSHALTDAVDPEAQLRAVFDQIAQQLPPFALERDWAVRAVHLLRAGQHLIWGRPAAAVPHVDRVRSLGWQADAYCDGRLSYDLLCLELEYGRRAAREALRALVAGLSGLDGWTGRPLEMSYPLARAFHAYENGPHTEVPRHVLRAFLDRPSCARNRGAWSILLRSILRRPAGRESASGQLGAPTAGVRPGEGWRPRVGDLRGAERPDGGFRS